MALTRKMLKAMGIEDEKADEIIEAHAETVDAHRKSAVKRRLTRSFRLICKSAPPSGRALHSYPMVLPVGLEPTTFRSGGERSDPLSYGAGKTCYYKFGGMSCGECGRVLKSGRLRELA